MFFKKLRAKPIGPIQIDPYPYLYEAEKSVKVSKKSQLWIFKSAANIYP